VGGIAEGLGQKVPKGYMYSAIAFSILVEALNLRAKRAANKPVTLHDPYAERHPELTTPAP